MGIPVGTRGQILHSEPGYTARLPSEIGNIHDDELSRHLLVEQGEYKVRTAQSRVHHFHVRGQFQLLKFLDDRRSKAVIREERISATHDHDLRVQHGILTHWISFWATILFSSFTTIICVAQETHGSYPRTTNSASCHGAPVSARLQVGKFHVVGTSISNH